MNEPLAHLPRLSVPTVRRSPVRAPSDEELDMLRRVGAVLIPSDERRLGVVDVADFDELASEALAIIDPDLSLVGGLVDELDGQSGPVLYDILRVMCEDDADRFYWLSTIVTGIFVYSDDFLASVNYPLPHRNAAPSDQIADELMGGILELVVERGSIYRPVE